MSKPLYTYIWLNPLYDDVPNEIIKMIHEACPFSFKSIIKERIVSSWGKTIGLEYKYKIFSEMKKKYNWSSSLSTASDYDMFPSYISK